MEQTIIGLEPSIKPNFDSTPNFINIVYKDDKTPKNYNEKDILPEQERIDFSEENRESISPQVKDVKKYSACGNQKQLYVADGTLCCVPHKNKWTNNCKRANIRCTQNILCKTSLNKIPKCFVCQKKYFLKHEFQGCSSPCKICNLRKSQVKLYGIKVCFQCEHQFGKLVKTDRVCQEDNNCNVNRHTRKPSCPICLLYYFLERGLKPAKPIMKQIEQKVQLCTRSLRNNTILSAIGMEKQNVRIEDNENIFINSSINSTPAQVREITPHKPCTVTLEYLSQEKLPMCTSSSQSDYKITYKGSDLKKNTGYSSLHNRIPTQEQLSTLQLEKVISSSSEVSEGEYDEFRSGKEIYSDADISSNNGEEIDNIKKIERADVLRRKETPLYFRKRSDVTKEFPVTNGLTIQPDASLHDTKCFGKLHFIDHKLFLEFLEFMKTKQGQKIFSGTADSSSVTTVHTMQEISKSINEQCHSVKESENIVHVNNEFSLQSGIILDSSDVCEISLVSENLLKSAINSEYVKDLQKHSSHESQGTFVSDKWNLSSITHEGLCSEVQCTEMTTNKDNLLKLFKENLSSVENHMQNRFQNGPELYSDAEQAPHDLNSESEVLTNMSCEKTNKLLFSDDENENCNNDDAQQTANFLRKSSTMVTNKCQLENSSNLEYSERISKNRDICKNSELLKGLYTTDVMPQYELKNICQNQYGVGTSFNVKMLKNINLFPVVKIKQLPFSVIKSITVKSADKIQKPSLSISGGSSTSGSLKSVDSETESCYFPEKESKRDLDFSRSYRSTDDVHPADKDNVLDSYLSKTSQTRQTYDHLLSSSIFKERQSNVSVLSQKLSFAEELISEDVKKCPSHSKKSKPSVCNVKSLDIHNIRNNQCVEVSDIKNESLAKCCEDDLHKEVKPVSPTRLPMNNVGSFYLNDLDTEILDYEPEPQDISLEIASVKTLEFEDLMISGVGSHREKYKTADLINSGAPEGKFLETDISATNDIERYMKTNIDDGTEAQSSSERIAVADEQNTDNESGIFRWIKKTRQRNNNKTVLNTRHSNDFIKNIDTQMLLKENHSVNLPTDDVGVNEEDTLSLCPSSSSVLMEDLSNNEEEPNDSGAAEKSRMKFSSEEPLSSNNFSCVDPYLTSERLKKKIRQSDRILKQESNSSKYIMKKIGYKNILRDLGEKNMIVTKSQGKSQGSNIFSSKKPRRRNNTIRSTMFTPEGYCRSFWLHGQCNRNRCRFIHILGFGKETFECYGRSVKNSLRSKNLARKSEAVILQHIKKSCKQGTLNKAFQDFQKVHLRQKVHFIKQLLHILASSAVKLKQPGRVKVIVQYIRELFLVDSSFCSEIVLLCEECMEHTKDALWEIFQLCSENKISLYQKAVQILMHAFMTYMRDWSKIFPIMVYGVIYCHIQIPFDILDLGLQELHHNPHLLNFPLFLVDRLLSSDFIDLSLDGIRNFISVLNKVGRYADAKNIHYKVKTLSNQQRSQFLSSNNNSHETNLLTMIHKFVDKDSWGKVETIFSKNGLEQKDGNVIFTIYNAISRHADKAGEKFSCFVRTVTLNTSHPPDKPCQYLLAQMGCGLLLENYQINNLSVTFEVLETMLDYKIDFYQLLQHDTVPIINTIGIPPLVIKSPSHVALVAVEICLTLEKLREALKILTMADWVITTNQNSDLQLQEQLWRAQLLKKLSTQLLKIEQLRNGALVLKKLLETLKNDLSDPKTQQNRTEGISGLYNQYIVKLLNWRDMNEAIALYEYFHHLGAWLDLDRPILRALMITCMQLDRIKEAHELFKRCCLMGVYTMQKEVQTEDTRGILLLESISSALFNVRERVSSVLSCRLTPSLELSLLGTQNVLIVNPYCLYRLLKAWDSLNIFAHPFPTFQTRKLHASSGQLQVVMQDSTEAHSFGKKDTYPSCENLEVYSRDVESEENTRKMCTSRSRILDFMGPSSGSPLKLNICKKTDFLIPAPGDWRSNSTDFTSSGMMEVGVNVPYHLGNRAMVPALSLQLGKGTLNNTLKNKNYRNKINKKRLVRGHFPVTKVDSVQCTNETAVGVESLANFCSGKPTRIKEVSNNLSVAPNCVKIEKSGLMTTQMKNKQNKPALESLKVHLTSSHLGAARMVTTSEQCDSLPNEHLAVKHSGPDDLRNMDMSVKNHLSYSVSQMKDLSAANIRRQSTVSKCQSVNRASRISFLTRKNSYVTKSDVSKKAVSMSHPSTSTAGQSIGMKTIPSPSNFMCTLSTANERIVFDKTFNYLKTQLLCRSATKKPEAELDVCAKTLSYQFITMEKKRGPLMVQKSLFKRLTDFCNANISFE
ncbi:uncharacterized protein LOC143240221 isoform X2 [Tachypleus tridentatus]|uniref:uncharacterized protein LOC143240221 isoform X2 n=1 Tax=Tachypleus tridentatus TaxID=6853 RepID=UPI003FD06AFF